MSVSAGTIYRCGCHLTALVAGCDAEDSLCCERNEMIALEEFDGNHPIQEHETPFSRVKLGYRYGDGDKGVYFVCIHSGGCRLTVGGRDLQELGVDFFRLRRDSTLSFDE